LLCINSGDTFPPSSTISNISNYEVPAKCSIMTYMSGLRMAEGLGQLWKVADSIRWCPARV